MIFFSTLVFSLLGGIYCALNWQKIKGRLDPWSVKYCKSLVGEKKKREGLENQIHCAYFMCTYDIECFWYVEFLYL